MVHGSGEGVAHRGLVGDVDAARIGRAAGLGDRLRGGRCVVGVEVEADGVSALLRHAQGDCLPDARARANHRNGLPVESEHIDT